MTDFSDLGLSQPILDALTAEGYSQPTPIQYQAIPPVLGGRDLCGIAQTGTGKTITTALMAVKDEIDARGLAICEAGIHGHGLASLEYPRFRHHAIAADREAVKVIGDRFEPGMVFAFNIDLFDPKWRNGETGCVFAETIVITDNGARRLHSFSTEFQRLPV